MRIRPSLTSFLITTSVVAVVVLAAVVGTSVLASASSDSTAGARNALETVPVVPVDAMAETAGVQGTVPADTKGDTVAAEQLDRIVALLKSAGFVVTGSKVESGDPEFMAVDLPAGGWDSDIQSVIGAFRTLALAKARGDITAGYANVCLVAKDGSRNPHRWQIPEVDPSRLEPLSESQLRVGLTALETEIQDAATKAGLEVLSSSLAAGSGGAAPATLAIDVVVQSGRDAAFSLETFVDRVRVEIRTLNAARLVVGVASVRAFDESGEQLTSEVEDFVINARMVASDIKYPSE